LLFAPTFTTLGHVSALTLGLSLALLTERASAATVRE
jgi:hypothetical protein